MSLASPRGKTCSRTRPSGVRRYSAQDGPLVLKAAARLLDISKRREIVQGLSAGDDKPAQQVSPIDELRERRERKRASLG